MTEQTNPPTDREFSAVMALIELLADPAATKARIADLVAQQATIRELTDALNEARADHELARVAVVTAEGAAKDRIAAEQAAHIAACAERDRALNIREDKIARAEAATKIEAERVRKLKGDLERKLGAVAAAAAAA
jgi:chromosome segregation ATPase